MKTSTFIAVAAGLTASIVSAQLENLPSCALTCALSSIGTSGCDTTDIACICSATAFVTALVPCVQAACSAAEYEQTVQAASGLCSAAGVTLSIPTATGSTSAPASSSEPATTSTTEVSTTETETSVSSTLSTEVSTTTTATAETTAPSANGTTTGPPSPSGTEPSSAGKNAVAFGGLGAIVALVAALL
ncbi:hypothetical protein ABW19_dt0203501 [Dactylella cylindrospora]|nr:hypothetical protein ABW19_dt0203501 [Dactylella cylindrospora]